jgi:anti-anti-sigma factor
MMNLATTVTRRDGCVFVTVDGELDLSTADQLQETLGSAIAEGSGPIVLDLESLRFCDSAGLAVMVRTHNLLAGEGRRLVIASPSTAVSRVLELSGLDQVIATATTTEDACAIASQP